MGRPIFFSLDLRLFLTNFSSSSIVEFFLVLIALLSLSSSFVTFTREEKESYNETAISIPPLDMYVQIYMNILTILIFSQLDFMGR